MGGTIVQGGDVGIFRVHGEEDTGFHIVLLGQVTGKRSKRSLYSTWRR